MKSKGYLYLQIKKEKTFLTKNEVYYYVFLMTSINAFLNVFSKANVEEFTVFYCDVPDLFISKEKQSINIIVLNFSLTGNDQKYRVIENTEINIKNVLLSQYAGENQYVMNVNDRQYFLHTDILNSNEKFI